VREKRVEYNLSKEPAHRGKAAKHSPAEVMVKKEGFKREKR